MPTLKKLHRTYPGQWLAMKVTEEEPVNREPLAGEVVARAQSREAIWEKVHDIPGNDLYVFFTGPLIQEGYVAAF